MRYSPPRWLEFLSETLVPPASAEHALGDLAECSRSDAEYARNLLSILPRVIWSQVRRRATIGGVVFHAVLSAFLLAAQGFPGSFFATRWSIVRLAVPWIIWVAGTSLAAAYGPRDTPRAWNWRVFAAGALGALASAAILDVDVVRVARGLGITAGVIVVLSMPWLTRTVPPPLSPETLTAHARYFQRMIRWRNARESVACMVVAGLNARDLWRAETTLALAGHLLLIAGVLFIMAFIHTRAASRAVPDAADAKTLWQFHRREVARQRDILRAIVWWYLTPFVPGLVVFAAERSKTAAPAAAIGLLVVLAVFAIIWRLNARGARWLDGELHKVDALEGQL